MSHPWRHVETESENNQNVHRLRAHVRPSRSTRARSGLLQRALQGRGIPRPPRSGAPALRLSSWRSSGRVPCMGDRMTARLPQDVARQCSRCGAPAGKPCKPSCTPDPVLAIWRLPRGGKRATHERPLTATPWIDTLVDLRVWEGMRATIASVRPLTPAEAEMDLRALARGGELPSRYELAARWAWPGESGASRARRLAESLGWLDRPLAEWNARAR